MINNSIMKGTYIETTDNMSNELSGFQDFLYRNVHNYKSYTDMQPNSNTSTNTSFAVQFKPTNLLYRRLLLLIWNFDVLLIRLERLRTTWQKLYQILNVPSMMHRNFQSCYLQFHLYEMTKKMYHMMLSHYWKIFLQKKQSTTSLNNLHHEPPNLRKALNEIQSMVIFIVLKQYHQTVTKKSLW